MLPSRFIFGAVWIKTMEWQACPSTPLPAYITKCWPHFSEHETSGKNARNSWDPLEGQTPIFVASLKQYTGLVTGRQFLRMLKACYLRDAPRGSKICSLHVPPQFGFGLVSAERQEMIWSYMAPLLPCRRPGSTRPFGGLLPNNTYVPVSAPIT